MAMLGKIVKWPRKRPREPGGLDSTISPHSAWRDRLRFKKHRVVGQGVSDGSERQPSSGLDAAAFVVEMLGNAFNAPVVNVLQPFVGVARQWCQTAQIVRNNESARATLENEAEHAKGLLCSADAVGNLCSDLNQLLWVLDDIARFLDQSETTESTKRKRWTRKLKLWLSAPQERDRIRDLRERLGRAMSAIGAAAAMTNMANSKKITQKNVFSELENFFYRTDTFVRIAFFS
ncbi:hypothetical protein B0H11DRAFT_1324784 [Mycena galericulata]|nr:hypothetical protein B0H11DRAFT_1324784 [Mycena galericulata]